jgi:hypothetical protein
VCLLVANTAVGATKDETPVSLTQVAPTVLHALGLDPGLLTGATAEGTQLLPSLWF